MQFLKSESSIQTVAFVGNYLPRKCGIATFTSDLLQAVAARHPRSRCFAVPVNDIDGCYQYPDVVRFEIDEQDLESYRRAAELLRDQGGVLVPFADPRAIAHELIGLLRDETRRNAMSDNAYKLGRTMVWSNTARFYMNSFEMARRERTAVACEYVAARELSRRSHEAPEELRSHAHAR